MRNLFLATATALSLAAVPAMAQTNTVAEKRGDDAAMSSHQFAAKSIHTVKGMDQAATSMTAAQREFRAEAEEIKSGTELARAQTTVEIKNDGTAIAYVGTPVIQAIPVAYSQEGSEYPVCTSDLDDHCINAWAAGMRGPGVDRPLAYWPGESSTDMQRGG